MKYELTQTKNGKRVYSETFNTFEDAQVELKRWYEIDELRIKHPQQKIERK